VRRDGPKGQKNEINLEIIDGLQGTFGPRMENKKGFQISDSRKWDSNQKF
jgi:hypothetical protein